MEKQKKDLWGAFEKFFSRNKKAMDILSKQ